MLLQLLVAYLSVGLSLFIVALILEKEVRDEVVENGLVLTLIVMCAFTVSWGPLTIWSLIK